MNASDARPIQPGERIGFLDLVRGIALFGILMVNLPLMNTPYESQLAATPWWPGALDRWVHGFIRVAFEGSFYVIFSALFAVGFHRMLGDTAPLPPGARQRYLRRLIGLAFFGALHLWLLWYGDVLLLYAIAGLLLLAFRRCGVKTLLIWAGLLLAFPLVGLAGLVGLTQALFDPAEFAEADGEYRALFEWLVYAYGGGSVRDVFAARWYEVQAALHGVWLFFPGIMAAMLFGLVLARRGIVTEPARHAWFFRRALVIALPLALFGKFGYAWLAQHVAAGWDWSIWTFTAALTVGGPSLALVYVAVLHRWHTSQVAPALQRAVSAAGRMALTNYLLQSLIATTLFYSYGLGWYGDVSRWQGVLVVVALYSAQLGGSVWWLRRFRYGPLEAVLRRWIYARSDL